MNTTLHRRLCPHCQRPASACICPAVRHVEHQAQVLILVHPHEAHQAKGTARLAQLCLAHCRMLVGESWAVPDLAQQLCAPWDAADQRPPRRTLLLYPPTVPDAQHPMLPTPPLPAHWWGAPARLRLVVLDGTWRKSRKMLWLNPALQRLPRLALCDAAPSRYAIRKAHAAHQLSTLEAVQQALAQLEPGNHALAGLSAALDTFVAQQLAYAQRARSAMLPALPHPTDQETAWQNATPPPPT